MRVLAISSPGCRWTELVSVTAAFQNASLHFVVGRNGEPGADEAAADYQVTEFTLFSLWKGPIAALQIFRIMRRVRPSIVLSTGAAPGVLAMAIGRMFGAKTVWVESITSVNSVSLSGKLAEKLANFWVAQWDLPSGRNEPGYLGGLL